MSYHKAIFNKYTYSIITNTNSTHGILFELLTIAIVYNLRIPFHRNSMNLTIFVFYIIKQSYIILIYIYYSYTIVKQSDIILIYIL